MTKLGTFEETSNEHTRHYHFKFSVGGGEGARRKELSVDIQDLNNLNLSKPLLCWVMIWVADKKHLHWRSVPAAFLCLDRKMPPPLSPPPPLVTMYMLSRIRTGASLAPHSSSTSRFVDGTACSVFASGSGPSWLDKSAIRIRTLKCFSFFNHRNTC